MSTEPSAAKGLPTGPSAPVIPLRDLEARSPNGSGESGIGERPSSPGTAERNGGPPPLPPRVRPAVEAKANGGPPPLTSRVEIPAGDPPAAAAAAAETVPAPVEERRPPMLSNAPSWLVSMVFHLVLMLTLAMVYPPPKASTSNSTELLASTVDSPTVEPVLTQPVEPDQPVTLPVVASEMIPGPTRIEAASVGMERGVVAAQASTNALTPSAIGLDPLRRGAENDLLAKAGTIAGDALSGRGKAARNQMVNRYGGTPASEASVNMALKWLAKHRLGDGGWALQLTAVPECSGKCGGSARLMGGRIAATGLALLPFLGAGQTHREGEYRGVVKEGLFFLTRQMKNTPLGGALNEPGGRMYSHGIAAIALCEAYAMTGDKALHAPAQRAVDFICHVQDPVGGGWRYEPFQPGDTSVVGWQVMALKSALFAQLSMPAAVLRKASAFLDSVQSEQGAMYGYTFPIGTRNEGPGDGTATTAIGLLCRMHMGWSKDTPALVHGVELLSQANPTAGNLYFNYYATQVFRHWEGPEWKRWNERMRDQLVASQSLKGHERGSWYLIDRDFGAVVGGRLYCTAMAAMTLEVYYRHMPIYSKKTLETSFPD